MTSSRLFIVTVFLALSYRQRAVRIADPVTEALGSSGDLNQGRQGRRHATLAPRTQCSPRLSSGLNRTALQATLMRRLNPMLETGV